MTKGYVRSKTLLTQNVTTVENIDFLYAISIISISVILTFLSGDNAFYQIGAISGVVCVVLATFGNRFNFVFGLINSSIYGIASLNSSFYGDAMLNILFYIPMQFIGYWRWRDGIIPLKFNKLSKSQFILALSVTLIIAVILFKIFNFFGGDRTLIDSANVAISLTATILMTLKYRDHWYFWILVNITGIFLWFGGDVGISFVLMWSIFLINSIYGAFKWR